MLISTQRYSTNGSKKLSTTLVTYLNSHKKDNNELEYILVRKLKKIIKDSKQL